MPKIKPQYITDNTGKRISVVLSINDYKAILEELEELEDIKLYKKKKKEDSGERISLSDYVEIRKSRNG